MENLKKAFSTMLAPLILVLWLLTLFIIIDWLTRPIPKSCGYYLIYNKGSKGFMDSQAEFYPSMPIIDARLKMLQEAVDYPSDDSIKYEIIPSCDK